MTEPLVTCVCPTTESRSAWLLKMITCFENQTYPNRELLIVTDHPGHLGVGGSGPARVAVAPHGARMGAKRNFACEQARGDIIAHFDDDDWSAPGRLADQVARLGRSGKSLTGYSQMKFTDGANWFRYIGNRLHPLGTSLCYRRDWWEKNQFPANTQHGSDTLFIYEAERQGVIDVIPCENMMYANIHGANLNNRNYEPPTFEKLSPSEAIAA